MPDVVIVVHISRDPYANPCENAPPTWSMAPGWSGSSILPQVWWKSIASGDSDILAVATLQGVTVTFTRVRPATVQEIFAAQLVTGVPIASPVLSPQASGNGQVWSHHHVECGLVTA